MRTPRDARPIALSASLALAATAAAPRPAHAQQQLGDPAAQAERHFQSGRVLFERQDYARALAEFRQAQALVPSPNTRLYIGLALRRGGAPYLAEAYRELRQAERDAEERAAAEPRYARTAALARTEAEAILPEIALVTVVLAAVPPGTVVRVNGAPVQPEQWNTEMPLAPGELTVDAEAEGRTPFHTTATLAPGSRTRVRVQLDPPLLGPAEGQTRAASREGWAVDVQSRPRGTPVASGTLGAPVAARPVAVGPAAAATASSPLTVLGGVAVGLGVLVGIGGGVAGAIALNSYNALERDCAASRPCRVEDVEARVAAGNTAVLLTNVGLIGGASLLAVGALFYGIGRASETATGAALPATARATPYLDLASGGAGVRGVF